MLQAAELFLSKPNQEARQSHMSQACGDTAVSKLLCTLYEGPTHSHTLSPSLSSFFGKRGSAPTFWIQKTKKGLDTFFTLLHTLKALTQKKRQYKRRKQQNTETSKHETNRTVLNPIRQHTKVSFFSLFFSLTQSGDEKSLPAAATATGREEQGREPRVSARRRKRISFDKQPHQNTFSLFSRYVRTGVNSGEIFTTGK